MAKAKKTQNVSAEKPLKIQDKLVLNRWLLSLFGAATFEMLSANLKEEKFEGVDEENRSKIVNLLVNNFTLGKEKLFEYDENIVRHTKSLKRNITWKYFQYLTLLFTEIYLDKYFSDKKILLNELNLFLKKFNESITDKKEKLKPFENGELNKLAFWNATGSGKTFLMHINLRQFEHYATKHKYRYNKTLLITPNTNLSIQHLSEFKQSQIEAEIFTKNSGGLDFGATKLEILEISKLGEKDEVTKVATESFGGNNLVFIDEGHRGSSGDVWKTNRDALSSDGFSFEYSATFGQAINGAGDTLKKTLTNEYAKSILFDYSYKYFYEDGHGKEYYILNLQENQAVHTDNFIYLVGAVLSFYQQLKIFENEGLKLQGYNLHKPFMVWVGGSVNAVKGKGEGASSDVVDVLLFLKRFLQNNADETQTAINNIISGNSGIGPNDIFAGKFEYLDQNVLLADVTKTIFLSQSGNLELVNIKNAQGEIGLKVGDGEYFGVINVGDDAKLLALCHTKGLNINDDQFASSQFENINDKNSNLTMLIGSKKFSEGWNSWRVSSMGLLNMGRSEGSQIIQLFGRGVRLKGQNMSLKRSTRYGKALEAKLQSIETLNIFGLNADYMTTFKTYLENEDVPTAEPIKRVIQTDRNSIFDCENKQPQLKTLMIDKSKDFKIENPSIELKDEFMGILSNRKITLDLFAKVNIITTVASNTPLNTPTAVTLPNNFLNMIDTDKLYLEVLQYKREKKYSNLLIDKAKLLDIFNSAGWYEIYAPQNYFALVSFKDVMKLYDTVLILAKRYVEEFYKFEKRTWEMNHIQCAELNCDDSNFITEYTIEIPQNYTALQSDIDELVNNISQELKNYLPNFEVFNAEPHLYCPLIFQSKAWSDVKVSPVALNEGESKFVKDLSEFIASNQEDVTFYLLRNQSKTGVGFFSESAFYPDFMLWILKGGKQYLSFIDPKGLRNMNPLYDPKIKLAKSIKEIQNKLGDCNLVLNSFIVSNTTFDDLNKNQIKKPSKTIYSDENVIFQEDRDYIEQIMEKIFY